MTEALLDLRKKLKKRKPVFLRQDNHKKKGMKAKWKRPKGLQSKLRLGKKGHRKKVSTGYGSPRQVSGLLSNGLKPILVANLTDLDKADKIHSIVISSQVGLKKKLTIVKAALDKGITIFQVKDAKEYLKTKEEAYKERLKKKLKSKKSTETQKEKPKTIEKITETETDIETQETDKTEKKEKDKLLTSRDSGF